jgi:hypothetical protein
MKKLLLLKIKYMMNKMPVKYVYQMNNLNLIHFFVLLVIVLDLVLLYILIVYINGVKQKLKKQKLVKLLITIFKNLNVRYVKNIFLDLLKEMVSNMIYCTYKR